MKRLVPTYGGHPIINNDLIYLQEVFTEYLYALLKDYTSTTDWVIISGLEFTDHSPGYTWTSGYVWNTSTKKLYFVLENTTPLTVSSIDELDFYVYTDEDVVGGTVENEDQVTSQVKKWDYVELYDNNPNTVFGDTKRMYDVIVDMAGGIRSIAAAGGVVNQETAWQSATLESGWSGGLKYRRTAGGVVELSSLVSRASITSLAEAVICVLPSGYRPTSDGYGRFYICKEDSGAMVVYVNTSGEVRVDWPSVSAAANLRVSNIVFGAD